MQQEHFTLQERLPSEFTQADAIRLQQFNAGLSAAKKQVDDGEITPEDGEVLTQGILRLRAPLLQAQEAQKKLIREQRVKEVQEDSALAQGIMHQDAVFRARGLRERVAPITDPMTGQTAYLYESSPQKFEQIQFGGQKGTEGLEGMTASSMTPPNPDLGPPPVQGRTGGNPANPMTPPNPDLGPPDARPQSSPSPHTPGDPRVTEMPKLAPDPETGGHVLEIWNGPNRQVVRFDANRQIVSQEFFDPQGFPVQPGQGGQMGGSMGNEPQLDEHEILTLRRNAELMVPAVPPPDINTPQTQQMYLAAQFRREQQVATAHRSLVNKELERRRSVARQGQMVAEHQRLEQVKLQRDEQEKTFKEKEARTKEFRASVEKYRERVWSEAKEIEKSHFEETGERMLRTESIRQAKENLAEAGFTEPVDPDAPEKPAQAASPVQKEIEPIAKKAMEAGDAEGVSAAAELAKIIEQYGKITKAPPEIQEKAKAILQRIQGYMGDVKPIGPPPPKTIDGATPYKGPEKLKGADTINRFGTGGPMG